MHLLEKVLSLVKLIQVIYTQAGKDGSGLAEFGTY